MPLVTINMFGEIITIEESYSFALKTSYYMYCTMPDM